MKNYSTQTGNTKPLQKSRALKQCAVARQGIASKIGIGFADSISGGIVGNTLAYDVIIKELGKTTNDTIDNVVYAFDQIRYLGGDSCKYESGLYFYHANHLSSTQLITDMYGSISQAVLYNPWGTIISEFRADWKLDTIPRYLFNAKELDEENGMYYYSARYYAPPTFISRDPAFEARHWLNPYHYCSNNPLNRIDPTGLFDIETGTIEKGDNLTKITKQINEKYGTKLTISDIAKANNIEDANKIQVGNKIALPGQNSELNFDLKSLNVTDATYGIDMPGLSWEATSGKDGYQSSEFQSVANKGPIPEGSYTVDPARTQSYSSTSTWDRLKGNIGLGTWPGGTESWGDTRTWLTPMKGTNTYGRSGFSIHGGTTPGSAGCIDLTKNNNSFHSWLKSYGKPVKLNVKY